MTIVEVCTFYGYCRVNNFDEDGEIVQIKLTHSKYRHFVMFPGQILPLFLKDTLCTLLLCCQLRSIGLLGSFDNLSFDSDIFQLHTVLQIFFRQYDS